MRLWSAKSDDLERSRVVDVGRGKRFAAEAGPGGGGGGFASELCKGLLTDIQHALLPLPRCGGFRKARFSVIGGVCRTLGSLGEGFGERGREKGGEASDLMASVGHFFVFSAALFLMFFLEVVLRDRSTC